MKGIVEVLGFLSFRVMENALLDAVAPLLKLLRKDGRLFIYVTPFHEPASVMAQAWRCSVGPPSQARRSTMSSEAPRYDTMFAKQTFCEFLSPRAFAGDLVTDVECNGEIDFRQIIARRCWSPDVAGPG